LVDYADQAGENERTKAEKRVVGGEVDVGGLERRRRRGKEEEEGEQTGLGT
jgi:hypothetical protein